MAHETEPPLVVHLVHGTWPYGSTWLGRAKPRPRGAHEAWFEAGSEFRRAVALHARRPIRFTSPRWSGENTFSDRHQAALCLRAKLRAALRKDPRRRQLVIAHSHGGTVALEAIAGMPREDARRILALVTLGTPFLALRPSAEDLPRRIARSTASRWSLVLLAIGALAIWPATLFGSWLSFVLAIVLAVALLGPILLGERAGDLLMTKPRGLHDLMLPTAMRHRVPCPVIAIRAPGDEASFAIAAAQIAEIIFGFVWSAATWPIRTVNRIGEAADRLGPLGIPTLFAVLGVVSGAIAWAMSPPEATGLDIAFFAIGIVGQVLASSFLVVLVPLMAVPFALLPGTLALARATGGEVLRFAGFATVDAEPSPAGLDVRMIMVPLSTRTRRSGDMRHSLHGLRAVQVGLGRWIRGLDDRVKES